MLVVALPRIIIDLLILTMIHAPNHRSSGIAPAIPNLIPFE